MPTYTHLDILGRFIDILKRVGQYRPPILILLFWSGLVSLIISQWILNPEPLPIQILEIGVPLMLTLPLLYTAQYVTAIEQTQERQYRILMMSLLFMVIASGTVALIVVSELAAGGAFREMLFPLVVSSSAGAGVGCLAGLNYDDALATRSELEAEVEHTRRLNQRLMVIVRILRHNVRNKLTVALGTIDFLSDRLTEKDTNEKVQRCRRALESLHSTAEKTLYLKQLQPSETDEVQVNLAVVIEELCQQVRNQSPEVTIRSDVPTDLTIRAHPLLPVAIEESVDNAITHNKPENLTIEIDIASGPDDVTITVTDDGIGIPLGEVESLDIGRETPLQHGSGVGLWLIKWITEASHGTYTIRTLDEGGTIVKLQINKN